LQNNCNCVQINFLGMTKVENVCLVLKVFNEVMNIISGSDYPTPNLFLPEV